MEVGPQQSHSVAPLIAAAMAGTAPAGGSTLQKHPALYSCRTLRKRQPASANQSKVMPAWVAVPDQRLPPLARRVNAGDLHHSPRFTSICDCR